MSKTKARDGKLYVFTTFDCFDVSVLGMAMNTNMKAVVCGAHFFQYLAVKGCITQFDGGST